MYISNKLLEEGGWAVRKRRVGVAPHIGNMFKSPRNPRSERLSFLEKNQNTTAFIKQSGSIHSVNCSQNPCRQCLWSFPSVEHPCPGLETCVLVVPSLHTLSLPFNGEQRAWPPAWIPFC